MVIPCRMEILELIASVSLKLFLLEAKDNLEALPTIEPATVASADCITGFVAANTNVVLLKKHVETCPVVARLMPCLPKLAWSAWTPI